MTEKIMETVVEDVLTDAVSLEIVCTVLEQPLVKKILLLAFGLAAVKIL